jgi:hypothetical protein
VETLPLEAEEENMSQQTTPERIMSIELLASLIASLIVGIGARIIKGLLNHTHN